MLYEAKLDTENYSKGKDAIFARYRMLAEMLGAVLLKASIKRNVNVMIETSGKDIAMYDYVDHFFPSEKYNRLGVHFTINDLTFAEKSVDNRMQDEMTSAIELLDKKEVVTAR